MKLETSAPVSYGLWNLTEPKTYGLGGKRHGTDARRWLVDRLTEITREGLTGGEAGWYRLAPRLGAMQLGTETVAAIQPKLKREPHGSSEGGTSEPKASGACAKRRWLAGASRWFESAARSGTGGAAL